MLLLFNELETSFFGGWQPCFWQVEFRASFSSGCRRASRCFPELSITYVGFQNYPYFLFIVVNKFLLVFNVPIEQVLEQKSIIRNSWSWTFSKCCRKIWNISWWWVTDIKYEGYTISFRPSVTFFFFWIFINAFMWWNLVLAGSMGQLPTYILFENATEVTRFPEFNFESKPTPPITKVTFLLFVLWYNVQRY